MFRPVSFGSPVFNLPAAKSRPPRFGSAMRITPEDTLQAAVTKLAGSDVRTPEVQLVLKLIETAPEVQAEDYALEGFGPLFILDAAGIYDDRISRLYTDVAEKDIYLVHALLLAVKMELLGIKAFNHAIDNKGEGIDVDEVFEKVMEKLKAVKASEGESP